MAKQSLFSACKRVFRDGISGTYTVGNNDIFLELYSQQDIDQNNEIGNSSEENIVVVAGDTITIPEGYTLAPVKPKKSLVVICNTFVNNGIVSMKNKVSNALNHDLYVIAKSQYISDVIIPANTNELAIIIFCNSFTNNGEIECNNNDLIYTYYTNLNFKGKITSDNFFNWLKTTVLKPIAKYMSKENMVYFLTNYIQRLKQGED